MVRIYFLLVQSGRHNPSESWQFWHGLRMDDRKIWNVQERYERVIKDGASTELRVKRRTCFRLPHCGKNTHPFILSLPGFTKVLKGNFQVSTSICFNTSWRARKKSGKRAISRPVFLNFYSQKVDILVDLRNPSQSRPTLQCTFFILFLHWLQMEKENRKSS